MFKGYRAADCDHDVEMHPCGSKAQQKSRKPSNWQTAQEVRYLNSEKMAAESTN
jgi:hypothetical protein